MLGFGIDSRFIIWLAWWMGAISFLLIFISGLLILFLRTFYDQHQKNIKNQSSEWESILLNSFEFVPTELPVLTKRTTVSFLVLWNYLLESLQDEAKENLIIIAYLLKLDQWAATALRQRNVRQKLLAIQTLGLLGEKSIWDELETLTSDKNSTVSLAAIRSLIKIDKKKAISIFLPLIGKRKDWSFSMGGKILKEAGPEVISEPFVKQLRNSSNDDELVRLLRYLDLAYMQTTAPLIRELLQTSEDFKTIKFCLKAVTDPQDLELVRKLLKHEHWEVRTQAASALGRMGTDDDEKRLIHAAGDQEWWVRYRAAQALANLPSISEEKLEEIAKTHQNFFGSDMIYKVIGERKVAL